MKYFLSDRFENKDGTIGNVCVAYSDLNLARMDFHQRLASHYIPENMSQTAWANVNIMTQDGMNVMNEYIDNTFVIEEQPEEEVLS